MVKSKIAGYLGEIVIMGIGIVITQFSDRFSWLGFLLIGLGVLGLIITIFSNKVLAFVPVIRFEKRVRSKTKATAKRVSWLDGLIHEHTLYPQKYLYPRLHRIFVSTPRELGIEVEWFNCTIFNLEFTSLGGEAHINKVNMGHQLKLRDKFYCSQTARCTCTFDIMVDNSVIKLIQDAESERNAIECGFRLNWEISPSDESKLFLKPFRKQWSEEGILVVPR